jgi:hypothetical protein
MKRYSGDPAPEPGPIFIRVQGCFSGHFHTVVTMRGIARSRIAAKTGEQERGHNRLFNFSHGIWTGFHIHHLYPAESDHGGGKAFCCVCYRYPRQPNL